MHSVKLPPNLSAQVSTHPSCHFADKCTIHGHCEIGRQVDEAFTTCGHGHTGYANDEETSSPFDDQGIISVDGTISPQPALGSGIFSVDGMILPHSPSPWFSVPDNPADASSSQDVLCLTLHATRPRPRPTTHVNTQGDAEERQHGQYD